MDKCGHKDREELMSAAIEQRNQDATCYVGNLDERVHEELLWELMLQAVISICLTD